MNYLIKLLFIASTVFAFDNEIIIRGKVLESVSIDILTLSENKDDIYLFTNSKVGARITIKELGSSDNEIKNILNNGLPYTLPMTYELFNGSSFLGTSPLPLDNIILGVDVSVH